MARIILIISGAAIAAFAIPSYFLLCVWVDVVETYLKRKGDKKKWN